MAKIILENVNLDYPIYNAGTVSLRHKILSMATGGRIAQEHNKVTVIRALSNVNLQINAGDRIGIMGHNGAGKTTLLRCLSGIYAPTSGNIIREGTLSSFLEVETGLEMELPGYDNIRRLLMLRGVGTYRDAQALVKKVEEFSELGEFLKLPVRTYSSGMLMRLVFSVAMAETPEIMIMDEFFSVGDEQFREKANDKLKKNIEDTSILVFASHSEELLQTMCNRFLRLSHGKLQEL